MSAAYLRGLPLAYSSSLVQGGLYPRWDQPYTLTPLVASTDSAPLDTGIAEGFAVLWLWAFEIKPTRIVLAATGAGLPVGTEGAGIFFSATTPGGLAAVLITPERRFFRLVSANTYNIRWQVERIG